MNEINPYFFGIFMIATIVTSALMHELGHKLTANLMGKKAKIGYDKKEKCLITTFDEQGLTDKQINLIFIIGILMGLLPLLIWLFIDSWLFIIIGMLSITVYLSGCKSDIKKLFEVKNETNS